MAKSLRSKVKRRYRKAKRQHVDETVITDRVNSCYNKIQKILRHVPADVPRSKNAFLYPNDVEAVFPRVELRKPLDFRSDALPLAGWAASGCRRKYDEKEKLELGLVVHAIDGCLDIEKRELSAQQESNKLLPFDSTLSSTTSRLLDVDNVDEDGLITSIIGVNLRSSVSRNEAPSDDDVQDLMKHQSRVGGRRKLCNMSRPVVKNNLRKLRATHRPALSG